MNQATNRTPYVLLTSDEKVSMDANNKGKELYERLTTYDSGWGCLWKVSDLREWFPGVIYRLRILPDIYYHVDGQIKLGAELPKDLEEFKVLRLAVGDEIPVKKRTGKELVGRLCWLWDSNKGCGEVGLVKLYREERQHPYCTLAQIAYLHAEEITPEELILLPNFEGYEVKK